MLHEDNPSDLDWMPPKAKARAEKRKQAAKHEYQVILAICWDSTHQLVLRHIRKAWMSWARLHGPSSNTKNSTKTKASLPPICSLQCQVALITLKFHLQHPLGLPIYHIIANWSLKLLCHSRASLMLSHWQSVLSDPSSNGDSECNEGLVSILEVNEIEPGEGGALGGRPKVIESAPAKDPISLFDNDDHENAKDVEVNLDECFQGSQSTIRDWATIWADIKAHLKKNSKSLLLPQLNQYLILCNFTTLLLNGFGHIEASLCITDQWHEGPGKWFAHQVHALAWHYQTFKIFLEEKHGSYATSAHSWINDESVEKHAQD